MTDIEAKALALINDPDWPYEYELDDHPVKVLCRAIEQHEAFKQKVSDIVDAYVRLNDFDDWDRLINLIIPKPMPDPLVQALEGVKFDHYPPNDAKTIRAALDALGFEIREKGQ